MNTKTHFADISDSVRETKAFAEILEFTCRSMINHPFGNSDLIELGLSCVFDSFRCRLDMLESNLQEAINVHNEETKALEFRIKTLMEL